MSAQRKALVIGASGQVGRACMAGLGACGYVAIGTYAESPNPGLRRLDISSSEDIQRTIASVEPDLCILAAALTNVELCEREVMLARRINGVAPGIVGRACADVGARLVYLSTEYVFDGLSGPYGETDEPNPINVYGRTKLEGEYGVMESSPSHVCARTTVVYSFHPGGKNFLMQLCERVGRGEPMNVPADQVSSPTYAPDLAAAVIALGERATGGIVNVVGPDVVSRFAFACQAADLLGLDANLIAPVTSSTLRQVAARPALAGLRNNYLTSLVGPIMRGIDDGVRAFHDARDALG